MRGEMPVQRASESDDKFEVAGGAVRLRLSAGRNGLLLHQITGAMDGFGYLTQPSPLIGIAAGALDSDALDDQWSIDTVEQSSPNGELRVSGHMLAFSISITLSIAPVVGETEIAVRLRLRNEGLSPLHVRAALPKIDSLATRKKRRGFAGGDSAGSGRRRIFWGRGR